MILILIISISDLVRFGKSDPRLGARKFGVSAPLNRSPHYGALEIVVTLLLFLDAAVQLLHVR